VVVVVMVVPVHLLASGATQSPHPRRPGRSHQQDARHSTHAAAEALHPLRARREGQHPEQGGHTDVAEPAQEGHACGAPGRPGPGRAPRRQMAPSGLVLGHATSDRHGSDEEGQEHGQLLCIADIASALHSFTCRQHARTRRAVSSCARPQGNTRTSPMNQMPRQRKSRCIDGVRATRGVFWSR